MKHLNYWTRLRGENHSASCSGANVLCYVWGITDISVDLQVTVDFNLL